MLPFVAAAQGTPTNFKELVNVFLGAINSLVIFIFGLTVLVLFWGIAKAWIFNAGDETSIEKGKKVVMVGVIVLTVMFGLWGILYILRNAVFGV